MSIILGVARLVVPGICIVGLIAYAMLLVAMLGEAFKIDEG